MAGLVGAVSTFTVAEADHGTMPRAHWPSYHPFVVKVYNRAGSPFVGQSIADWNSLRPDLIRYDDDVVTGGDPYDCSAPPVDGAVAICRVASGNPYGLVAGGEHLAWGVVGLAWDDLPTVEHEMGHTLGLGHHHADFRPNGPDGPPWGGGIMGGEGRITGVDLEALTELYSHRDAPPGAATTAPGPAPVPASAPPAPVPSATPPSSFGYSCGDASNVGATSATLTAISNDPSVSWASFTLYANSGYTQVGAPWIVNGPPFRAQVSGLAPSTAYTYKVFFTPGDHAHQGPPCAFTTSAAPTPAASPAVTASTPPPSVVSAGASAAAASPPPTSPPPTSPPPTSPPPTSPPATAAPATTGCIVVLVPLLCR